MKNATLPPNKLKALETVAKPSVTRWAALVSRFISEKRAAWEATGLHPSVVAAAFLCIIDQESGGNPNATNKGSAASGLTQFIWKNYPQEYPEPVRYAPAPHIEHSLMLTLRFARRYGKIDAALFARGYGRGNFEKWLKGGGQNYQAAYFDRAFRGKFPAYSAWLHSWITQGSPTEQKTLKVQGKPYTVVLAKPVPIVNQPMPNPYTGTYRHQSYKRTFKPGKDDKPHGGKGGAGKSPESSTPDNSGVDGSTVATAVGAAGLLGGVVVAAQNKHVQQVARNLWRTLVG